MKKQFTIYHNPRCSKSRKAIEILDEAKANYKVVKYLEEALDLEELMFLYKELGENMIRSKEDLFKQLENDLKNEENCPKILLNNRKLIERPILFILKEMAVIGRPVELISGAIST